MFCSYTVGIEIDNFFGPATTEKIVFSVSRIWKNYPENEENENF